MRELREKLKQINEGLDDAEFIPIFLFAFVRAAFFGLLISTLYWGLLRNSYVAGQFLTHLSDAVVTATIVACVGTVLSIFFGFISLVLGLIVSAFLNHYRVKNMFLWIGSSLIVSSFNALVLFYWPRLVRGENDLQFYLVFPVCGILAGWFMWRGMKKYVFPHWDTEMDIVKS